MNAHLTVAAEPRFVAGASVRSRALGIGLKSTVRPITHAWAHLPFDLFPPNLVDVVARLLPVPEGTQWRKVDLPQCRAEFLRAKGVQDMAGGNKKVVLYFHGGAFLAFGLNTHRRLVARVSLASNVPVLNVGYRQMPKAAISSSISDGVDAFRWLLHQGYRAEDITLAGDSAGGFLAFAVTRALIDRGVGTPRGIVAISPWLDLDNTRKLAHPNANSCHTFTAKAMNRASAVADRVEVRKGLGRRGTCPVDMEVGDLPPVLIQIGSTEILMPDAELMANRLIAANVPCELHIWDRQVHVFHAAAWLPEARSAVAEIGRFISALPDKPAAAGGRRSTVAGRRPRAVRAATS